MRIVYWLVVWLGGLGVGAFDLQCSKVGIRTSFDYVKVNTCEVKNMNVTQKGSRMTSATSINDIDSLKGFWIYQQTVNFVPRFDGIARRLELLRISSCHLRSISRDDLRQFPNLRELELMVNDLTSLPANLFEFNERLEGIAFRDNKLKFIGTNILQPLKSLKRAYFPFAGCIDMDASTSSQIESFKSKLMIKCKDGEEPTTLESDEVKSTKKPAEVEEQISDLTRKNEQFKQKIVELETKVAESQKKASEMELKLRQQSSKFATDNAALSRKLKICDKMLDAATKNLAPLLSHADSSSSDNRTVDVFCENFTSAAKVCEIIDLSIEKSATAIGSVKDQTGRDVSPTSLIVQQQPILFLPINLGEAFPDLVELEVSGSGIFVFDRKSFKGLDKLKNLNLTSNKLLNIASESFAELQKLATLDLSHNNLESIEFGAFKGLGVVQFLDLNGNTLKEIATKFMLPLKSLESLNLLGNACVGLKHPGTALDAIEAAVLENCTAPIAINCASSNDRHVCRPENLKVEQPKVKILKIVGLSVGQSSTDVTELLIEDQIVNFLPHQLVQSFPRLHKLVVSSSELTQLTEDDFVGFADLTWIEICDNNLSSIHPETFNAVPQLVHLDLSSNHIESLPPQIFERLTQLVELRLSINGLRSLRADTLSNATALKIFRIDNNKLEEIDPKVPKILKTLDEIDMSDNTCIDAKYEKTDERSTKALREILADVVFSC